MNYFGNYIYIHNTSSITDVKQFLKNNNNLKNKYDALKNAALYGHLKIVKLLVKMVTNYNNALQQASQNGHYKIVKYLIKKGANITNQSIEYAIRNGHLKIVKFLIKKNNYIIDENYIKIAINYNRFKIITFLLKLRCNMNTVKKYILLHINHPYASKKIIRQYIKYLNKCKLYNINIYYLNDIR